MAQERPIPTTDHSSAAAHEPVGSVAQRRGLPRVGRNASCAEENLGDFAVRCAIGAAIHGSKHLAQSVALLLGEMEPRRGMAFVKGTPQLLDGLDPVEAIIIKGNDRGERIHRTAAGDNQNLDVVHLGGMVQADAVAAGPSAGGSERIGRVPPSRQPRRHIDEKHNAAVAFRRPEDGLIQACAAWPRREIATPSAAQGARRCAQRHVFVSGFRDSPPGIRCCDADTPTRFRLEKAGQ
jgi:hypothetical protein